IGNGAYTVIAQAAAERLGIPYENVSVAIGDSDLPPAPVAGGSNSTASTCSTVMVVCDRIRQRLLKTLTATESAADKATVGMRHTPLTQAGQNNKGVDLERAFDVLGVGAIEEFGEWKPDDAPKDSLEAMYKGHVRIVGGPALKDRIAYAFGAEFVEVRVNQWTGEIRVPRLLGAFACGRIINPRTPPPQFIRALILAL